MGNIEFTGSHECDRANAANTIRAFLAVASKYGVTEKHARNFLLRPVDPLKGNPTLEETRSRFQDFVDRYEDKDHPVIQEMQEEIDIMTITIENQKKGKS